MTVRMNYVSHLVQLPVTLWVSLVAVSVRLVPVWSQGSVLALLTAMNLVSAVLTLLMLRTV